MKNKLNATISFLLLSFAITFMAPIFDSSFYGFNGHPIEWMSFLPTSPLRHAGISILFSPFLHLNTQHLLTNLFFFTPIAMMMERKRSGLFLALHFFLIHFQVLLLLVLVNVFYPLEGKAFLGSSHIIIGLYSLWSVANKKFAMMSFALLILVIGMWQGQGALTLLAHALGLLVGIETLFLGRLWVKFRSQPSH